jgi:hypothetical protein
MPPDRVQDAGLRRLYESLASNPMRQDGDVESIVLRIEEPELASLAVELYERGEAMAACRDPGDTGPGPLGRMLHEALDALKVMEEEAELAARRRAASENKAESAAALRAYTEARVQRQGFIPPSARRRGGGGT